jgi:exopolysaccharide biosynthesis protein
MRLVLCLALLPLASTGLTSSSDELNRKQPAIAEFRKVGRGIEHLHITRGHKSENEKTGPWRINLLRVDPKQADIRVAHALDEGVGLETTSSIAARYGAVAAVNAGFFRTTGAYRGESSGVLMIEGKLISEPLEGRSAFGLIKRASGAEIIFGHLRFSGSLETDRGRRLPISGLNRPRDANELIVYTPEFHKTTLTTPDGVEAIVRRNRVIRVRNGGGSSAIPLDGVVVSAIGTARDWVLANLRAGTRVRLESGIVPIESEMKDRWNSASYIVGGGPQLVKESRVSITFDAEKIAPRFVSDRHPRTAIARLSDGRILLTTVDGRQPGVSNGMSLPEIAVLVLEFGATDAINLDGGGSTTMVVSGKLVNAPSDQTGERPVSDAILILPRPLQQTGRVH